MDIKKFNAVLQLIQQVPEGKVVTYNQIALKLGITNPRIVGRYLHKNPDRKLYPCHRVVSSDGSIASGYAFGGRDEQIRILQNEGIKIMKNKVDLSMYLFDLSG